MYQSLQPVMDVCLELCVIEDSACEAEQDTYGHFQRLERAGLSLAAGTFWKQKQHKPSVVIALHMSRTVCLG